MGCDIHLFIEYVSKDDKREEKFWSSFSWTELVIGRDYRMFGYLTNGIVRYNEIELDFGIDPREVPPNDLSETVKSEWEKQKDESHNFSWLTFDEYKMILKAAKKDKSIDDTISIEYLMVLKIMKWLEKKRYKTRILFWFDS